jgi:hypothetical protein
VKRATLIFLALLVVLSFYMVIPSTAHASDGGGQQVVKVEHVNVNLNLKPLSAAQLKVLRDRASSRTSSVLPNVVAANACAAVPNDHNCDGQDPIYQGCIPSVRPITKVEFDGMLFGTKVEYGAVELKYSTDCKSNWAKGYTIDQQITDWSGVVYDTGLTEVDIVRSDGLDEPYYPSGNEGYTNMVYAPVLKAKACIDVSWVDPSNTRYGPGTTGLMCTPLY